MVDVTGSRIREMRKSQGMTQDDLALKSGYKHRSSINKIEKDSRNVTMDKIKDIAIALHVTPEYLLGWSDDPHGETSRDYISEYDIVIQQVARNCDKDSLITYAMQLMSAAKDK